MKVEAFLICDAATNQGGKLNVLGAFDAVFARETPVVQQSCSIALRLRFDTLEAGQHQIRIAIIDEDGNEVVPAITGKAQVRMQGNTGSGAANFIFNMQKLKFDAFGTYEVRLQIDGESMGVLPLRVQQVQQQPPGSAGAGLDLPPPVD